MGVDVDIPDIDGGVVVIGIVGGFSDINEYCAAGW